MTCNDRLAVLSTAALALIVLPACETDLSAALDQVRAAVPQVCKEYCEDKLSCEWQSTSDDLAAEAFSSAVRRCTVDCAFVVDEGAFASERSPWSDQATYVSHVGGDAIAKSLTCLFDLSAYGCIEGEDPAPTVHGLALASRSRCEAAANCLALLDTDRSLIWQAKDDHGACVPEGRQELTVDFFE